jgi:hypothetical protein
MFDQMTFQVNDDLEIPFPDSITELITKQSSEIEQNSTPSSFVPKDTQAMVSQ